MSYPAAIGIVAKHEIDVAAIDSHLLPVELRIHPKLAAQIRVIDSLVPSTMQLCVAAAHIPPTLRQDVQNTLEAMHLIEQAQQGLTKGLI